MTDEHLRRSIAESLAACAGTKLEPAARDLLRALGYESDRQLTYPATARELSGLCPPERPWNDARAMTDDWVSVAPLFQLTGDDINRAGAVLPGFEPEAELDNESSFLFFAVDLKRDQYRRSDLAGITREINRPFLQHAIVLFRHGDTLTLSVIERRAHKRDEARDVLEKVTLIKDIRCANPHRAHVDILCDLSLGELRTKHAVANWDGLHRAWRKTLDISELNKRFYRELANWYFWALKEVWFPHRPSLSDEAARTSALTRLVTRVLFCWFMKEKGLIPEDLFRLDRVRPMLNSMEPEEPTYYRAILQNLFFATLNTEMDAKDARVFLSEKRGPKGESEDHTNHGKYRYRDLFADADAFLAQVRKVPFVNGGLFMCLDRRTLDDQELRDDGFSEVERKAARVPNELFFGGVCEVNLTDALGPERDRVPVRGLYPILSDYKFTVAESTPIEKEVALDPVLLGHTFENLLAANDPDTGVTVRRKTGSYYTPPEIVSFMVNEALVRALTPRLVEAGIADPEAQLRDLFAFESANNPFEAAESPKVVEAISNLRVLDHAGGSGAFPLGTLQAMEHALEKLDPGNIRWKEAQLRHAQGIEDPEARQRAIEYIEQQLQADNLDYGRKLFLIERCLHAVDIQDIAVQIARLRFFIALAIDQSVRPDAPNLGIHPLPNLEPRVVCADSLVPFTFPTDLLTTGEIQSFEAEVRQLRRDYVSAAKLSRKRVLQRRDAELRQEMLELLKRQSIPPDQASMIAEWNPYDPVSVAGFMDPDWMFGVPSFDIVITNPPWVRAERLDAEYKKRLQQAHPQTHAGAADLYCYFYSRAVQLLKPGGVLAFISSNKWFRAKYGEKLRAHLATECLTLSITDFGELPVFDAGTFPMIYIARKKTEAEKKADAPSEPIFTQVKSLDPPYPDVAALIERDGQKLPQTAISKSVWLLTGQKEADRIKQMEKAGVPLGICVHGRIYYGIKTGFNEAFIIDQKKRDELIAADPNSAEIIKPLAVGDDIRRWHIRDKRRWLILTKIGVDMSRYPAVFAHLKQFQFQLEKRWDKGEHWWELRACAYYDVFERPKIVYPVIGKEPRFTLDRDGFFSNDKTFLLPLDDAFLVAVLNSALAWEFLKARCSAFGDEHHGGRLELRSIYMAALPIPEASEADRARLAALAQQCLDAQGVGCEAWEAEIDAIVAGLYGL